MADDWRLTASLADEANASRLRQALHLHEVAQDVRDLLGGRIAVSGDGNHVFLYTDSQSASQSAARESERVLNDVLAQHNLNAQSQLDAWHHDEEEWRDASVPLPHTAAEHQAEHTHLEQQEQAESAASGLAEWEARIELPSHHDASSQPASPGRATARSSAAGNTYSSAPTTTTTPKPSHNSSNTTSPQKPSFTSNPAAASPVKRKMSNYAVKRAEHRNPRNPTRRPDDEIAILAA